MWFNNNHFSDQGKHEVCFRFYIFGSASETSQTIHVCWIFHKKLHDLTQFLRFPIPVFRKSPYWKNGRVWHGLSFSLLLQSARSITPTPAFLFGLLASRLSYITALLSCRFVLVHILVFNYAAVHISWTISWKIPILLKSITQFLCSTWPFSCHSWLFFCLNLCALFVAYLLQPNVEIPRPKICNLFCFHRAGQKCSEIL